MKNNYKLVQICFAVISILILVLGILGPNTDVTVTIIAVLALVALVLFDRYTPQIANLSPDNPKVKTMRRLNMLSMAFILILFCIISWLPGMENMSEWAEERIGLAIVVMVMTVIGNVAPKIPFNRYMGLRLPWTIRDEATWKVAHRILGYITFPLVLILIVCSLFGEAKDFIPYCIIAWIAIPGIYSAWFYFMRLKGKE